MFHMLGCVNLKPEETIEKFSRSLDSFSRHMIELDLLESTGEIGKRVKHPVMDTDDERDFEYFFVMTFRDREQCDLAVDFIYSRSQPEDQIHKDMYAKIADYVFVCWQDVNV